MELAKCAVVAVFLYFILKLILSQKTKTQNKEREERKPLPVEGAYKKRWLLTYNEKDAYKKLLDAASEVGYTIFSKVRLLDLLEQGAVAGESSQGLLEETDTRWTA